MENEALETLALHGEGEEEHVPHMFPLEWETPPQVVLVIYKPAPKLLQPVRKMIEWLTNDVKMDVWLLGENHPEVIQSTVPRNQCISLSNSGKLSTIDLIITLGGDGTVLHAISLFHERAPPMMSFALGSLGFLTPFGTFNTCEH